MILYYITRGERVGEAFAAGVDWIQVRAKDLCGGELFDLVKSLPRAGKLLVNDRLDVALACGLDGVHLPANRPAPTAYRKVTPQPLVIGVSCHTVEEVRGAAAEGADFVVLGPVFPSPGKGPPLGLAVLQQACRESVPVLALGGVTLENAGLCREAGAAGLAGIRLFQDARDIAEVVAHLRRIAG